MIVAVGGRPRTGKSELARHLAIVIGGVLLDLAQLRTVMFPTSRTTSHEQAARLYEWLLQAAVWNLHQRPTSPVVLDAHPLTRARDVRALRHLAGGIGHRLHVIECVRTAPVSEDPAQKAHQDAEGPPGDAGSAGSVLAPKIVVDTQQPMAECITEILHALAGSPGTERFPHAPHPYASEPPTAHSCHC
ncbi:hypothetical protein GCM10017667_51780 [Streptomyces filamentosus]|uniref:Uncharacterized protein n=1 Tax=Streptomyces filamentosus TaxID=67294 RepID=A0A919BS47_STRFL|nr:hypothetical protein GCM10017667_51780 [Streptomyces filamentosus]